MNLDQIAHIAQTWGLIILGVPFLIAVGYALWPSNKKQFDEAAHVPLDNDELDAEQGNG